MMHTSWSTLPGVADLTRCPHCGRSLRYLTVAEAASELDVSVQTVRDWIRSGKIRDAVQEQVAGGVRFLVPVKEVTRLRRAALS